MMSWPIKAAQDAGIFDAIIVSTDDDEIAQVARDCGAEAPFKRPTELSGDHALTLPVIAHAIRWFEENRGPVACACCIYATAPFLEPDSLRAGLEVLQKHKDAEFAFGVTSYAFPIFRALQLKPTPAGNGESARRIDRDCVPLPSRQRESDRQSGQPRRAW